MNYVAFEKLCKEKGTTPTAISLKLGLKKGNTTSWKNGGNPSVEVLTQLAVELDCSTDYLLGLDELSKKNPAEAEKERNVNMENKEFKFDIIEKFILNVIKLTQYNKINWEIDRPQYDNSKLSQRSLCIRINGNWNNYKFVLISQDKNFNFEVYFEDSCNIAEELPLASNSIIQKNLATLFSVIEKHSEIYDKFERLFSSVENGTLNIAK